MISDPTLARPGDAQRDPDHPVAGDSWADRPTDELRQILSHGVFAGEDFQNAARELERRARATTPATEDDEVAHRVQQIRYGRYLLAALALIFVVALILGLLL